MEQMPTLRCATGLPALTEREKETLRLLLGGHDAKSIARHLGLSVHTVNERLRDARRKMDVSSSREAARLLAEAEQADPHFLTDKQIGVPMEGPAMVHDKRADRRHVAAHRLAWFGGGMLIMSLVIAAAILSFVLHGGGETDARRERTGSSTAIAADAAESASLPAARAWLALLDRQRWDESWRTAATLFQSQLSAAQWTLTVQPLRQSLGAVTARGYQNVTKATSLPGVPTGEYEIVQFHTSFANRQSAVETVVLARQSSGWKVAGYFIK